MNTKTLLPALAVITLSGCGGGDEWTANQPATVEAAGYVKINGMPVEGAAVTFAPVSGKHAASAVTDSNGYFELRAFKSKEGAVPGDYMVAVSKTEEIPESEQRKVKFDPGEDKEHADEAAEGGSVMAGWRNVLPSQFASPVTSGLKAEVPSGGTSELLIELL